MIVLSKTFLTHYFGFLDKNSKRKWDSASLEFVYWTRVNIITYGNHLWKSPMENCQGFLDVNVAEKQA